MPHPEEKCLADSGLFFLTVTDCRERSTAATVPGGGAELEVTDAAVYMAISVRNVGTGLAVMRGWRVGIGLPAPAHLFPANSMILASSSTDP